MGAFFCKQPNGLYCMFSTVVDCPTHYNMTEQDVIDLYVAQAKEQAKYDLEYRLRPFEQVIDSFIPGNMTQEKFDKFLEETK